MADGVFNVAKGRIAYYSGLPAATDAIEVRLLKSTGLEADDTLNNYNTLSALLAASNDEATFASYAKKTITSVTLTTDDTNNRVDISIANQTWSAATAGQTLGKLLVLYKPSTTATSTAIIPLAYYDFNVTTNGSDLTAQFNSAGIMRAQ